MRPQLDFKKIGSDALKMGDLSDPSKKARYSNMVFQFEDDQLELDESDINELDQNMQTSKDNLPTSLFGRVKQGIKKMGQQKNGENYLKYSSHHEKQLQARYLHNPQDRSKKVSLINYPRDINDIYEEDSFREDEEFENGNKSLIVKDKNIFTNSYEQQEHEEQNQNQNFSDKMQYLRDLADNRMTLRQKTSNMMYNKYMKATNDHNLKKYDSMLNEQFVKTLQQGQDRMKDYHFMLHALLIAVIILNNIFSILIFLIEEYIDDHTAEITIDMVIMFFYIIEFIYNYQQHPQPKSAFFSSYFTWIDLASMTTPLITLSIDSNGLDHIKIVRILRVSKVIRILRLIKIIKSYTILQNQQLEEQKLYMQMQISPILQQVVLLVSQLLIIEFLGAALVNIISQTQDDSFSVNLNYLDALYYMIITSATVGFGDIYPKTLIARTIVVMILLCVFIVFGDNISKIGQLMKQANFNDKYYYMKDHIVIFGTCKSKELSKFIMQLIELSDFDNLPEILIVGTQLIKDTDLELLIKNDFIDSKVKYLSAINGIDQTTLRKANIHNCKSVFFLGHLNVLKSTNAYTQNLVHNIKQIDSFISTQKIKSKLYRDIFRRERQSKDPINFYVQLCSSNQIQNFLSKDYIQDFGERLYSMNVYKFKCEVMSQALFSPGTLPFISNFFISNAQPVKEADQTKSNKIQFSNLKYKLRIAQFPLELIGMKFYDAVQLTYKSQQSVKMEASSFIRKSKKTLKMILFGIIPKNSEGNEVQIQIQSLINPGQEYVISVTDKAYLMVREINDYSPLSQERLDLIYQQQIAECFHAKENRENNYQKCRDVIQTGPTGETEQVLDTEKELVEQNNDFEKSSKMFVNLDSARPLVLSDIKLKVSSNDQNVNEVKSKMVQGIFTKIVKGIDSETKKEDEEAKRQRMVDFLQRRFLSAISEKETETQLMQSFENYLRSLYTYRVSLKKYQYLLWDEDKIQGKISNHILVFGFNQGLIHFVKATREKCDLPIVIFYNEDISLDIFKMNNLFGNIFHFWGDPFDKSHLDKSCITQAYGVVVLQDHRKDFQIIEDGTAIGIVRNIEQFYQIDKLIVEISDISRMHMLGYEPKETLENCQYYYWPFIMNGKILAGNLFDTMIAWTQCKENHLDTLKKFVSNDLLQKQKRLNQQIQNEQEQLENNFEEFSNVISLQVPPLYPLRGKNYSDLMKDFMTMNCICIGIYRQIQETNHEKLLEEEFSFLKDEQIAKTFTIRNQHFLKDLDDSQEFEFPPTPTNQNGLIDKDFQNNVESINVMTNLSDFKCNFTTLHTEQLILNPPADFQLSLDDKVLVIGQIPVKSCESFLLMHRMKKRNQNGLDLRKERRQLAIEALELKLKRRERNLNELQKELYNRTHKYAQFSEYNKERIQRTNVIISPHKKATSVKTKLPDSLSSEVISSFSTSHVQDEINDIIINETHKNELVFS
eukprot:403353514